MSVRVIGEGRERVIKEIENLEQAVKVEMDVESGYNEVVQENISYWMAVGEDIVDSYTSLLEQTDNEKVRSTLAQIIEDSKNHVRILRSVKDSFSKIISEGQHHAKLLQELSQELEKCSAVMRAQEQH